MHLKAPASQQHPEPYSEHAANPWDQDKPWDLQRGGAANPGDPDRVDVVFGRQKSSLAAEMADEGPDDVIPALPHVSYTEGGQNTHVHACQIL